MCDLILAVIVRVHGVEIIHREPVTSFMLLSVDEREHRQILKHVESDDAELEATAIPRLNRKIRPVVLAFLRDDSTEWHSRPTVPAVSRLCKTNLKTQLPSHVARNGMDETLKVFAMVAFVSRRIFAAY